MVTDLLLIALGLGLLLTGGEALVRGATGLALLARVSAAVAGLTVVAAGTSAPELVVSLKAAFAGAPGLAFGNVVGSNMFNVGLIVGLTAVVRPLRILGSSVRLQWPVMMCASIELFLLARDGSVDRLEGFFLSVALLGFISYIVWTSTRAHIPPSATPDLETASFGFRGRAAWVSNGAACVVGAGCLAGGSHALVEGAASLAAAAGVSNTLIGLTVVAAGTSAPELVTSLVASYRGKDDIAVANVIGSNIFNCLAIVGLTATIHPLKVPEPILSRDIWWMLAFSLALFPLMRTGMRVGRGEGALLLAAFVTYNVILIAGR